MALSPATVWEAVLGEMGRVVAPSTFEVFLQGTVGVAWEGDRLVVRVPSPFVAEYLEKRLSPLIDKVVEGVVGRPLPVHYRVAWPASTPNGQEEPSLDPRYTFETFVAGPSNDLAYRACRAVAEKPGGRYNPLFLFSAPGLGKTHLLHATAHRARQRGLQAEYLTAEQFTASFIQAVRGGGVREFLERLRSARLLLMDDLHCLAGKGQTQEGFLHLFNDLYHAGAQVVLTADRPPSALKGIDERLRSRLAGGLVVEITPPDLPTRRAILRAKASLLGLEVPEGVLEVVARRGGGSVREVEGLLLRLCAFAEFRGTSLTPEVVALALGEEAPPPPPRDPERLLALVARHYGLEPSALRGPGRDRRTAHARRMAMFLLHREGFPLSTIGRLLGGRDHSTVAHACRAVAAALRRDPALQGDLQALSSRLGEG